MYSCDVLEYERDLLFQNGTRRVGNGFVMVVIEHVAQNHYGGFKPRNGAQGIKVGLHNIVAVAAFPAGTCIAFGGSHLQIGGQQIVTAMGFLISAINKMLREEAFAHQAALHVDHAHKNGVNLTTGDGGF